MCGPNGFVREVNGRLADGTLAALEATLEAEPSNRTLRFVFANTTDRDQRVVIRSNAYRKDGPWEVTVRRGDRTEKMIRLLKSHSWYDFTVQADSLERRFTGRLETGSDDVSDPAMSPPRGDRQPSRAQIFDVADSAWDA